MAVCFFKKERFSKWKIQTELGS
uniref:Uncharacterized protein n=1 Tax=Arundo donax TaxID=35708 RepID=A0A0A9GN54_ARUDO